MLRASFVLLVIAAGVLVGCDRRVLPYVPLEEEPPPTEGSVSIPGLSSPAPPRPRMSSRPAAPSISGSIRLASGVRAPDAGVVFVIARGQGGGPPLAVKRIPVGSFPLDFSIGPPDVMIQGHPFAGPLLLTVLLDGDGNPDTRAPGDLAGEAAGALQPGASGVELVLRPAEG